uniref:Replication-associated protein n=1 Tax=Panicum streak virus TaxID=10826 RepID=D2IW49_9GEMI|nr:RepA [Panicum streak virus]
METTVDSSQTGRHTVRSFRHRNVNTFLTYSKCPLEPEFIGEHLFRLTKDFDPAYILVVRETHIDGTWHCHALLQTTRPVSTSDERYFDIDRYHPNIQSAKSTDKVRSYILKDPKEKWEKGTYIPRKKSFSPPGKEPSEKKPSKDEVMREIMTHATSREEYLSMVQSALPYDWATKLSYFEYSASRLFPDIAEPYTNPHEATDIDLLCNETVQDWLEPNIYQVSPQAYMLLEPSCLSREQAIADLQWLSETTRLFQDQEREASTSSAQHGQVKHHGPEASDDTTIGRTISTGLHMMKKLSTMSSTTFPSSSVRAGSSSSAVKKTTSSTPSTGNDGR